MVYALLGTSSIGCRNRARKSKDPNAIVTVKLNGNRKAYIIKYQVFIIAKILRLKISNTIRLKVKEDAIVNIVQSGFKVDDDKFN